MNLNRVKNEHSENSNVYRALRINDTNISIIIDLLSDTSLCVVLLDLKMTK